MQQSDTSFVVAEFEKKAQLFLQRHALYGDNYKNFGRVMSALFPNGFDSKSVKDLNRLGVFVQIVSKLTRYAEMWNKGGHSDSLDDMAVYAMMLREIDHEQNP